MLLMVLIGWIVAVPAITVAGLYCAAMLLGARARRHAGADVTGLAQELVGLVQADASRTTGHDRWSAAWPADAA